MMWNGCWFSSLSVHLVRTVQINGCWIHLADSFLIWEKTKACSVGGYVWVYKKLCNAIFPIAFHGLWKKLAICHLVWEILNAVPVGYLSKLRHSETQYLSKLRHSLVPCYGLEWLAGIVDNHSSNLINKFGNSFLIRVRLRAAILP